MVKFAVIYIQHLKNDGEGDEGSESSIAEEIKNEVEAREISDNTKRKYADKHQRILPLL